ncbi:MAG: hypothetical protein EOR16_33635 [Mesorhizobium sp.]|uniref:DUF6035 family protein n=1 Tax=Mesorhizobium sp. TaxID=1871066 RepID=UPI000FE97BEB|nr:DUF6035 family protein [Mesorhizobium sp.]RWI48089.1 MAG: hypothetical protein EOR16_33635 [Mesorhizobium sp.]
MQAAMVPGNITIDPLCLALPVEDAEITEVLDLTTGEYLSVNELIGSFRYDHLIEERGKVRSALHSAPLYKCALCPSAVYLVSSPKKRFFFRHLHEDGSCAARTRSALSRDDIRARKYHGLRESEPHRRIKRLIERSLLADPTFRPESVLQEKRWYVAEDRTQWRQPDVQALHVEQRIAFEAQLSTTFLDVVIGRRDDYRKGGAQLVWIMAGFEANYRRLTTDDILFSNNSNVFVVDDETCRLSETNGEFHLRCFYREPYCEGEAIKEQWVERVVRFSELTMEADTQRTFFFNFENAERELLSARDEQLRSDFFALWTESATPESDVMKSWGALRQKLAARSVSIPERPDGNSSFSTMIHGLLSAFKGEPVGWQFQKLVQVAHHIAEMYPQHVLAFAHAIWVAKQQDTIEHQDTKGRWRDRSKKLKQRLKEADPSLMPDQEWLPALCFLFPEVGARVSRFLTKAGEMERNTSQPNVVLVAANKIKAMV